MSDPVKHTLAVGDIKVGRVVRRKRQPSCIYVVRCFFKNDTYVGGFPPTIWDPIEAVELCPVDEVPAWIVQILMGEIYDAVGLGSIWHAEKEKLQAENERLRHLLDRAETFLPSENSMLNHAATNDGAASEAGVLAVEIRTLLAEQDGKERA